MVARNWSWRGLCSSRLARFCHSPWYITLTGAGGGSGHRADIVNVSSLTPERESHLEARRTKSVIALHASDFMRRHPAFDRYRESYPRRSELHQNYYSRDGDEQSAVPAGV